MPLSRSCCPSAFPCTRPSVQWSCSGRNIWRRTLVSLPGVTLGLATSMAGIVAPLLGLDRRRLRPAPRHPEHDHCSRHRHSGRLPACLAQQTHGLSGENIWEGGEGKRSKTFPLSPFNGFHFYRIPVRRVPGSGRFRQSRCFFRDCKAHSEKGIPISSLRSRSDWKAFRYVPQLGWAVPLRYSV